MSRKVPVLCLLVPAVLFTWFEPSPASALLEECGAIDLNTDATCEVSVEGGCDVICDTSNLTLACSGELYAECRADRCEVDVDVGCSGSCTADCAAECDVDPGNFSCQGSCEASCDANCDAQCSASGNKAECQASCQATCSGECSGSCEGTPPRANCEAKCEASCQGQCRAEANVDCQIDCQADGYLDCKADMRVKCEAQCKRPEGVVVCDGQFIDARDVKACVGAIEAALNIDVEVTGSAEGDCSGNQCSGSAKGSVSCAVAPRDGGETSGFGWLAAGLLAGATLLRRARRN